MLLPPPLGELPKRLRALGDGRGSRPSSWRSACRSRSAAMRFASAFDSHVVRFLCQTPAEFFHLMIHEPFRSKMLAIVFSPQSSCALQRPRQPGSLTARPAVAWPCAHARITSGSNRTAAPRRITGMTPDSIAL